MITVPDSLASRLLRDHNAQRWIDAFPTLARGLLADWRCAQDGDVRTGQVAVIIPVLSPDGPAVIKISYPEPEATDECRALTLWQGNGAVRLLDSAPDRHALLLERLTDQQLDVQPDEGIVIGGQLLARLAVPAPPDVKRLADTAPVWEQQLRRADRQANSPLPGRAIDAALATIRDLGQDAGGTMLHGDLHGGNILHSPRGWIAIDPKGLAGTAAYDALTMCSYRRPPDTLNIDHAAEMKRRIRIFSDAAGVDPELSRRCAHARAVTALLWDLGRGDVTHTSNFVLRMRLAEGLVD